MLFLSEYELLVIYDDQTCLMDFMYILSYQLQFIHCNELTLFPWLFGEHNPQEVFCPLFWMHSGDCLALFLLSPTSGVMNSQMSGS